MQQEPGSGLTVGQEALKLSAGERGLLSFLTRNGVCLIQDLKGGWNAVLPDRVSEFEQGVLVGQPVRGWHHIPRLRTLGLLDAPSTNSRIHLVTELGYRLSD